MCNELTPSETQPAYLSLSEFAQRLNPPVSYSTVKRWVDEGEVKAHNTSLSSRPHYSVPFGELSRIQAKLNERSRFTDALPSE